ncbi:MAG: glycosyltransferase family 4 protein [Candidatus Omnitrophica bacterium]|nr:glycosyltransferase family 4 protein [Candidatus Omnitrophota bacterium]
MTIKGEIGILTIASKEGGGVYQYTLSLLEVAKVLSDKYKFVQIRSQNFPKILNKDIVIRGRYSYIEKLSGLLQVLTGIRTRRTYLGINPQTLDNISLIISPVITLIPYHFGKPYIVTIHDFQQEYYPEFFTLKERIIRKIVYKTGIFANLVVAESQYVKQDIIKFLKVEEDKIKVLPSPPPNYLRDIKLSIDRLNEVKMKYNLPQKYIFYPAQFWYHKNHLRLLESLKYIAEKYRENVYLILVGSKKNNYENVMKKIAELGLTNQVKYLGYVPDEDMPYLYKLSTALVMPTLFESVSLPIWEAFYLGVPVVSSNVCALPEQVGNAGLIFDPLNIEDMAEKIYMVWKDEKLRSELVNRGYERVKDLTIENYAKQWEKIIEEVLRSVK